MYTPLGGYMPRLLIITHTVDLTALMFEDTGYAVLPEFSNPLDELQISFWIKDYDYCLLQLGYITAEDDGTCNTFTAIADYYCF